MSLVSLQGVTLSYGAPPLLDGIDLTIEPGERVCLLGRNGAGKSTLLRVIDGTLTADGGERRVGAGMRIARLEQEAPAGGSERVLEVVAGGLGQLGALVAEYYARSHGLGGNDDAGHLARLAAIQHQLEAHGGWEIEQRAERVISRLGLDPAAPYAILSGGLRRRVLLARALVSEPDLLLLDEPTNHLDIDTIEWLEQFLLGFRASLLFVTHDRRFLRRLATRILELDRGRLTDWPGDYENYLRRLDERANAEAKAQERFDKRLAEEEVWIRQGIKARRTRNEGRVRALETLRDERQARREGPGQARIRLDSAGRSGRLVCEAEAVSFSWPAVDGITRPIIDGLDTLILRGDRVGIIGPNGAGKSTLLKLLLGELTPTQGNVRHGTNLKIAYFDQLRATLDPTKSVRDNLAQGSDRIEIGGASKHVMSYLRDFLFTPERANQPVAALSGGERNRLLLARLFAQPANLLVMDEPTNDLDAETLDLLEDLLLGFDGTLLLVSHDRDLLDNVVTSTLVLTGAGHVGEYVGGYTDWLRQRPAPVTPDRSAPASNGKPVSATTRPRPAAKLSYKDQRELTDLPQRIEAREAEQTALQARLGEPSLYQGDGSEVVAVQARLAECEAELTACYDRWETLEALREAVGGRSTPS